MLCSIAHNTVMSFEVLSPLNCSRGTVGTVPQPFKSAYSVAAFQGRHASPDEITASAYQAVILDQQYNGEPVQVRVTMGKEPAHLMAIFKGRMVVYSVSTRGTDSVVKIVSLSISQLYNGEQNR